MAGQDESSELGEPVETKNEDETKRILEKKRLFISDH
jgi:hypothetical protein